MNFLKAELEEAGGRLTARGGGFALALPDERRRAAASLRGRSVEIGIRPSAFRLAGSGGETAIDLDVLVSEYVGAQSVLVCDCSGSRVLVEIGSEDPIPAEGRLRASVDPAAIHLFDPQTEAAL
jgi:multiple sugar transport system ATP-binding protein